MYEKMLSQSPRYIMLDWYKEVVLEQVSKSMNTGILVSQVSDNSSNICTPRS
jgi:hypothetical protein